MATYLSTGTVGLFDVDTATMTDHTGGATIPTFTAIDSAGPPQRKADVTATAARIPEMVNFLSARLGPYPFETVGLVADWVPDVGYVLENQTKPHFAGDKDGPQAGSSTLAHELAHQWMGDSISPAQLERDLVQRGLGDVRRGPLRSSRSTAPSRPRRSSSAPSTTRSRSSGSWRPPRSTATRPSSSTGSPSTTAPGRCSQGLRKIIGSDRFFDFARDLDDRHGGGNISRGQFVSEAKRASGFHGQPAEAARRLRPPVAALGPATAPDPRRLQALTYRTTNQEDPR